MIVGPRPVGTRQGLGPGDAGFTLIELLVVLVIIPLIIGGVAEALLVSFQSTANTSNRLSDSVNAQLTSDFLVRDLQGAAYITSVDNSAASAFSFNAPQICKPASAGTLLVGLFHPATSGSVALDVAYWLDTSGSTTQLDRYSCTFSGSPSYTSTSAALTALATAPPGTATGSPGETISAVTDILPGQFQGAASLGWTPVGAFTTSSGTITNLSTAATVNVASTAGFSTGTNAAGVCALSSTEPSASGCANPPAITIATTLGPAQVVCTGFTATSFTGCSSPGTGTVTNNSSVTQSTVSQVQLALIEPSSGYKFNLVGTPRAGSPQIATTGNGGPTLLTLGSGGINPIHGGGSATCPDGVRGNICIGLGGVIVDAGGTVFCTGAGPHTYIHFKSPNGNVDTVAPASSSACNTVQVGPTPGIPDPLALNLPNNGCLTTTFVSSLPAGSVAGGVSTPGLYTGGLQPSGKLEPGLYVLEGGIGNITGMTTPAAGDQYYHPSSSSPYFQAGQPYDVGAGALLYVPGPGPYRASQNCFTFNGSGLGGSVSALVPLDQTQSADYFLGDSALGGVWLWQDATNTSATSVTGNTGSPAAGLLYAPGSTFILSGNSSLSTGSMIIGGVSLNGTDKIVLNW